MADTLELEESELFDVNEHSDVLLAGEQKKAAALRSDIDNAADYSDDESETGLVDGFDDLDSSTASAGRSILAAAAGGEDPHVVEMATSHDVYSEVGSLKRFDPVDGVLRFGSEGDLALAASAPNRGVGVAMPPPRSVTPDFNAAGGYLVSRNTFLFCV